MSPYLAKRGHSGPQHVRLTGFSRNMLCSTSTGGVTRVAHVATFQADHESGSIAGDWTQAGEAAADDARAWRHHVRAARVADLSDAALQPEVEAELEAFYTKYREPALQAYMRRTGHPRWVRDLNNASLLWRPSHHACSNVSTRLHRTEPATILGVIMLLNAAAPAYRHVGACVPQTEPLRTGHRCGHRGLAPQPQAASQQAEVPADPAPQQLLSYILNAIDGSDHFSSFKCQYSVLDHFCDHEHRCSSRVTIIPQCHMAGAAGVMACGAGKGGRVRVQQEGGAPYHQRHRGGEGMCRTLSLTKHLCK